MNISITQYPGHEIEIQRRRAKILRLFAENPTMQKKEMGIILGIHPSMIARDLEIIQRELREESKEFFDLVRKSTLEEIEKLKKEAWRRLDKLSPHQGARWMEEILRALDMRNRMLGFYVPKMLEVRETIVLSKAQADAAVAAALAAQEHNIQIKDTQKRITESKEEDILDAEFEEKSSNPF